jgi:hypothetical protein
VNKEVKAQWTQEETEMLQYAVHSYVEENDVYPEDLTGKDWNKIAEYLPAKDGSKCKKRWLFIQNQKGNKIKWTQLED